MSPYFRLDKFLIQKPEKEICTLQWHRLWCLNGKKTWAFCFCVLIFYHGGDSCRNLLKSWRGSGARNWRLLKLVHADVCSARWYGSREAETVFLLSDMGTTTSPSKDAIPTEGEVSVLPPTKNISTRTDGRIGCGPTRTLRSLARLANGFC